MMPIADARPIEPPAHSLEQVQQPPAPPGLPPEAREAIAKAIREAQQTAAQAREQAREAQLEAQAEAQAQAQAQARGQTRVQVDGNRIIVGGGAGGGGRLDAGMSQRPREHNPFEMIPPQVFDIVLAFFLMIAFIAVGIPLARAFGRRMDRQPVQMIPPPELSSQLQRIEHAVEAMAIEVERISEAQRYMARLESERGADPAMLARPGRRD